MLLCFVDESIYRNIYAQIDDDEPRCAQHYCHQVLAEIVKIAFDGADHHRTRPFLIRTGKKAGFQVIRRFLKNLGSLDHLRYENLTAVPGIADIDHRRCKRALQDILGADTLPERLLH